MTKYIIDAVKGGAVADGTAIVAGTSGNTDFDSAVIVNAAGTIISRADYPSAGISGVRTKADNTTSGTVYVSEAFSDSDTIRLEIPLRIDTTPSAETTLVFISNGATRAVVFNLTNTRLLRVRDAGSSGGAVTGTSTTAVPLSTNDFVLLLFAKRSTGSVKAQLWTRGASSPLQSMDLTMATPGTLAYNQVRIGAKGATSAISMDATVGDTVLDTDATDIGYPSWLSAPVIPATPPQARGVWVDMSGTTAAVGPLTYSASPSTGTKARTDGIFLPAPTTGTTTYNVTATDTGTGQTATRTVDVDAAAGVAQPRMRARTYDGAVLV